MKALLSVLPWMGDTLGFSRLLLVLVLRSQRRFLSANQALNIVHLLPFSTEPTAPAQTDLMRRGRGDGVRGGTLIPSSVPCTRAVIFQATETEPGKSGK